jgi:hypothetical protein
MKMEPPPEILNASAAARRAFTDLELRLRQSLFLQAAQKAPQEMQRICRKLSLPGDAFRNERAARLHSARFSELLQKEKHEAHLLKLLSTFFVECEPELNDLFWTANAAGSSDEEALARVVASYPAHSYLRLFQESVRWARGEDAPPAGQTASPADAPQGLTEISRRGDAVYAVLESLRKIQPVDVEMAIEHLRASDVRVRKMAEELRALAELAGEPVPAWSNEPEYQAKLAALHEKQAARANGEQVARAFLLQLGDRLEQVRFHYKSMRVREALEALASAAATEARAAAQQRPVPRLPGPETAAEWLTWAVDLNAAEEASAIAKACPRLAEFLTEADSNMMEVVETSDTGVELAGGAEAAFSNVSEAEQPALQAGEEEEEEEEQTEQEADFAVLLLRERKTPEILAAGIPVVQLKLAEGMEPLIDPEPDERARALGGEEAAADVAGTPPPVEAAAMAETEKRPEPDPQSEIDESMLPVLWRLVREDRLALAAHLAEAARGPALPPAWVFRAAALAPRLQFNSGPLKDALAQEFSNFTRESLLPLDRDTARAARLLLAAATLRPALLAPTSGGHSILSLLEFQEAGLPELHKFCELIARFSAGYGEGLLPETLQTIQDQAGFDVRRAALKHEIHSWLEEGSHLQFRYAPALIIWRVWMQPGGPLRTAVEEVLAGSGAAALRDWDNHDAVLDRIREGMREYGNGRHMEGVALRRMQEYIGQTVQLGHRWLQLAALNPAQRDYRDDLLAQSRQRLEGSWAALAGEIAAQNSPSGPAGVRAAAQRLQEAAEGVRQLFTGQAPPAEPEPAVRYVLGVDLLCSPGLTLDAEWRPDYFRPDLLPALRELAARPRPDWPEVMEAQCQAQDHAATDRLLDYLAQAGFAPEALQRLRERREAALRACRSQLRADVQKLRGEMAKALKFGFCSTEDFKEWQSLVELIQPPGEPEENGYGAELNFQRLHSDVAAIRTEINRRKEEDLTRAYEELAAPPALPQEVRCRIEAVLKKGDLHTARSYLERARQEKSLPETFQANDAFERFFGAHGWLERFGGALALREARDWRVIDEQIRARRLWHGLAFDALTSDAQAEQSARLVEAWYDASRSRDELPPLIEAILSGLGFPDAQASTAHVTRSQFTLARAAVRTSILDQRGLCPVASFGSEAGGRYQVLCVWDEPDVSDLMNLIPPPAGDTSGQIVFYFGFLDAQARRVLGRLCREQARRFIVLDDALLLSLSAEPSARLAALFHCALPFSHVQPYNQRGTVPPEMFFGRREELDSVMSLRGARFVYGGRQLGKTALLEAVRREFHRPEEGHIALYFDVKVLLMSRGRPLDDIWSVLLHGLKDAGVVPENAPPSTGPDRLFQHIFNWLKQEGQRRLLLLIDEADDLLEEDGTPTAERPVPFRICTRLKGWMDDTANRLKVVFAGLHNVQRTTRVGNNPLAHYGQPICIGPMLSTPEARSVQDLIEIPLACAGYLLEDSELAGRILALTNYYPSLVQLFCSQLLKNLQNNYAHVFDAKETPPCIINAGHLEDAFDQQNLHREMRQHFELTLDLDRRYRVITYALAHRYLTEKREEGVSITELLEDAQYYWPQGFVETRTHDEFRALLEEMAGLGILREVTQTNRLDVHQPSRFALRNANVMLLLGNKDEIDKALNEASQLDVPLRNKRDTFRRQIDGHAASPLTAAQEGEIKAAANRVVVVHGCLAAGLEALPAALRSLFPDPPPVVLGEVRSLSEFRSALSQATRRLPGYSVTLVPATVPWDAEWLRAAQEQIRNFTSQESFTVLVFVADPEQTAALLPSFSASPPAGVRQITLQPWHDDAVRLLIEANRVRSDRQRRERLRRCTGNWPLLLEPFLATASENLDEEIERAEAALADGELRRRHCAVFGLELPNVRSYREMLSLVAGLGDFSVEEIVGLMPAGQAGVIGEALAWAEALWLANRVRDRWELDPFVTRLLERLPA